jgi:hypothetical protein
MTKDHPGSWFVASVRKLPWQENELGATCEFDKQRERFDEFGINLTVLRPGQPMMMYHRVREWDYFHCPRDVAHAIVGSGVGLSLVLAVGSRIGPDVILYPRDETALKHGAGVEQDTPDPQEAYARFTRPAPQIRFRSEFLAEWPSRPGAIPAHSRSPRSNVTGG